ncbi:WecB/TagA/CpsF family glycosyltransferase [Enterococcus faecium]|uniref:WecB/TagA/CpsF family glycosyltransferase n=1 Tax=Enterococcus faecium TaxID=1352 RepID=UPI002890BD8C|nr:WecB/TagA/CpsF family glycosyltransferase [Enterococcus faecium]MDT2362940.1 WecB/TagA/CpsF family glycosyltransferase [Enterococcus faecium]
MNNSNLLGSFPLFLGSMEQLTSEIVNNVEKKAFFAINTDCYLIAQKDSEYRDILKNSNGSVYVDGMGIIYGQKFLKMPVASERISTTDLFPYLFAYIENKQIIGKKVYLLGGKKNTARKVAEKFSSEYSYVEIVGHHDGYSIDFQDSSNIIKKINEANVDFLFVGFGCPLQEKWVNDNFHKLNVKCIMTCGGLFDYYAENVKRAPKWMQKIGLEWFYRFLQEPKRLFRRYFYGNMSFGLLLIKHKFNKEFL